jgi:hypothetical protein
MKKLALALGLTVLLIGCRSVAAPFLTVSNPPPYVQLGWTALPGLTYNVYYGVGSGQYTNKTNYGATNLATVLLPARGVLYYFAATAVSNGLESQFSSEVNYTPSVPPAPPTGVLPPVTLSILYKNDVQDFMWANTGMSWSLDPNQTNELFALQITKSTVPLAVVNRAKISFPPMPGN